uniref:Barrier-to-autointegration factor n=2 Tax=Gadus morhua TaxID=8049 RepID=A0A8C5CLI7_GADMO
FSGENKLLNMATKMKHADLMSEPLGRKRVDALPGIGNALARRLEAEGYDKVFQVVGQYMVLGKDEERFNRWLHDACGANRKQQYDCHKAINGWYDNNM